MLFNSLDFALFLPVTFFFYWFVFGKNLKFQNIFLVFASYVFYGWWDWKFLTLIVFSTVLDYSIGLLLCKQSKASKRKMYLALSIFINLGFLGFFKYYNFFVNSFTTAFSFFGGNISSNTLNIILPIGISFYTFQTLSYTIDVYRQKIEPTKDFISFSAFVCFFPQLVAGPIERASKLLPQFYKRRVFDNDIAVSGFNLIIWGLFKKIVIADSCALYVNAIFKDYESLNSLSLLMGAIYFSFQIYGDFSGYSDIAIGTSRLFGFDLNKNFNYPYFSRDISEFWRRWHISLSTWFRDYLYIPLGGSKRHLVIKTRNIFIIFIVSGFWHGANWTFIIWGFLNAIYYLPLLLANKNRIYLLDTFELKDKPSVKEFFKISSTFFLVTIGWVFFRSNTVGEAFKFLKRLLSFNINGGLEYLSIERYSVELIILLFAFVSLEWFSKPNEHPFIGKYKVVKIILIIIAILTLGVFSKASDFIYFQF